MGILGQRGLKGTELGFQINPYSLLLLFTKSF